jgi:hypothetical protein
VLLHEIFRNVDCTSHYIFARMGASYTHAVHQQQQALCEPVRLRGASLPGQATQQRAKLGHVVIASPADGMVGIGVLAACIQECATSVISRANITACGTDDSDELPTWIVSASLELSTKSGVPAQPHPVEISQHKVVLAGELAVEHLFATAAFLDYPLHTDGMYALSVEQDLDSVEDPLRCVRSRSSGHGASLVSTLETEQSHRDYRSAHRASSAAGRRLTPPTRVAKLVGD